VSWRLTRGLLNFIVAVVVLDYSIWVVVVIVNVVGDMGGVDDMGDMLNAEV
jgi:hypothetical protein